MSSLIGSVGLSNNQNSLFLGSVNLSNLNINPNELLYSTDGINLTGLNLGDGLDLSGSDLQTIGNSNIQLTSNSIYVNDNVNTIQSAIDVVSQADTIYISSGSFGESQISIDSKLNIALCGPPTGLYSSTICEVLNGFSVKGTSDLIRFSNLQIKGSTSLSGLGRYKFSGCVFTGTSGNVNVISIQNCTKFLIFYNCEFDNYCTINIANTFASAVYFINCGINGATITLNNSSPLQCIFNNCSGFSSYPLASKATFVGLNVLASGSSNITTNNINGVAYPPASVSITNQTVNEIPYCTSTNNTLDCNSNLTYDVSNNKLTVNNGTVECQTVSQLNEIILSNNQSSLDLVNYVPCADGVNGLKWSVYAPSLFFVDSYSGQLGNNSGNPVSIFQKVGQTNIVPQKPTIMMFSLNMTISGGSDVLTLSLINDDDMSVITSLNYNVGSNGHTVSGQFNFIMPDVYTLNYTIVGQITTHTITLDTNSAYGITIYQNLA